MCLGERTRTRGRTDTHAKEEDSDGNNLLRDIHNPLVDLVADRGGEAGERIAGSRELVPSLGGRLPLKQDGHHDEDVAENRGVRKEEDRHVHVAAILLVRENFRGEQRPLENDERDGDEEELIGEHVHHVRDLRIESGE